MVLDHNPLKATLIQLLIVTVVVTWAGANTALGGGPLPIAITAAAIVAAAATITAWKTWKPTTATENPPDTLDPPRS